MNNAVDRFVNQENIIRFADGFAREADPARRRVFKNLLHAEEHRLGMQSWYLELAESQIANAQSVIDRQTALIAGAPMSERELQQANLLLANCQELRRLFAAFRSTVMQDLDRGML